MLLPHKDKCHRVSSEAVYMRAEARSPLQEGSRGGAGAEVEVFLLSL